MKNTIDIDSYNILGTEIHAATMEQVLDAVDHAIQIKQRLVIGVVNAAKLVRMSKDDELAADVSSSHLVLADGMSVVMASRILGMPLPERVAGIDIMEGILRRGREKKYRVFCLGATEEVSAAVQRKFEEHYPGVQIVGRRNGYFSDDDEQSVAETIASTNPDVLFVAITSPKKERFMARWADKLNATVVHGVGGSFDVVAGKVDRATPAWQKLGLEWLFRMKQEPGRLWKRYLYTNSAFMLMLMRELLRRLFRVSGR